MSKIILKKNKLRNIIRSVINESFEDEGRASQKTINRWLNATPEEIARWRPELTRNPTEFADLQRMALRQPYNRTHLAQASRDIEDAWRLHNGLPSLKTWKDPVTGKILRKISSVDAQGNPVFTSKTPEQRRFDHNRLSADFMRRKRMADKENRRGQQIMTNITDMDSDVTFPNIPSDYYDEIVSQLKAEYGDKYIDPFTLKSQYDDDRKNINEMSKIILKESEIRNYVRSLIREALETEGHASPKTIQKWLNATPEEIATWNPEGKQDPSEFAALQKMALRQPYDRTHLAQAARDIEDAWRKHNGLPSLKTWKDPATGKILRKISSVDAQGNPVFTSRTEDEKKVAHREVAKLGKRESDAKKKEVRRIEKETQKAEEERIEQAEREAMAEEEMKQWCQENGIDPTTPQASEMYAKHIAEENEQWYYNHGLDEFSAEALRRRIDWLNKKIKETENSSNTFDYNVCTSCEYVLKDAIRILRQNFGPRRKKLPKKEEPLGTNMSDEEIDAMSKEGKEAAAQDMYGKDSEFMAWCGKFGCDANEQTKAVFDSYMGQYNKWCSSTGRDASDPETKKIFGEIYDEYTKKQLNGIKNSSLTTPQKNRKTKDDYEDDEIDNEPMYDDDDMRGNNVTRDLGQWDSAYDDDGHFNSGFRYSDWN